MVIARVERYCARGNSASPGIAAPTSSWMAPHVRCRRRRSGATRKSGRSTRTGPIWRASAAGVIAVAGCPAGRIPSSRSSGSRRSAVDVTASVLLPAAPCPRRVAARAWTSGPLSSPLLGALGVLRRPGRRWSLRATRRGEPVDEVQRCVGHLAPPVVDRERVTPVRDLHDLRHCRVLALALVGGVRDRPRHGVVLLAVDDEQWASVGVWSCSPWPPSAG